ncbi:hypothetical protein TNCV_278281 [Trichonephila clavipes]|nr:hypothetical protein TNCV_278281 [Trichonephila clavipes]
MALSIVLEIALHLMHWALYCVSGHDLPSFSEILIFLVGMEIIKNYFSNHHCTSEIGNEIRLSLGQTVVVNDNRAIPYVRSTTIYAICRALDLKAELIPIQDTNQDIKPTELKTNQHFSSPPAVFSFTVFKICEALELKAELRPLNERPVFKNKHPRPVPTVRSGSVFLICQALELNAELAKI